MILAFVHHAVTHLIEVIETVQRAHVRMQAAQVQRCADRLADVIANHVIVDLRIVFDPDCGNDRRSLSGLARGVEFGVLGFSGLELRQACVEDARGAVAGIDHLLSLAEIGHAERGQRRLNQHIVSMQSGQLFLGIAPGHQGDRLVEHIHHRGQLLAVTQRRADIDDDGDVDAHFSCDIQRDVVGHAAVDQQAPVELDRGEHRRDRHAGADHLRQVTFAKHHFFAIGDVGGHRAKRDRQLVEVAGVAGVGQQAFQQQREVLALNHSQWQAEAAVVAKAEFLLHQKVAVVLLAAKWHVLTRRGVGQRRLPVDAQGEFFQLVNLVTRGVQAADHRAHAGTGNRIDFDALFFQCLEHADVRQPACSAAGQHQADFRSWRFTGVNQQGKETKQQAEQQTAHCESRGKR